MTEAVDTFADLDQACADERGRLLREALASMPKLCVNCAGQGSYLAPPVGWVGSSVEAFVSGASVRTTCSDCAGSGSAPPA